MADILTKQKRSEIMSKVKNKDSKLEVKFRKKLWRAGFRRNGDNFNRTYAHPKNSALTALFAKDGSNM